MKPIRSIFILVSIILFQSGNAQYFNFNLQNFNSNNGLPGNDVECLYQDNREYIWIGTRFGLSMFDGTHFRNFSHDPNDPASLGGSRVFKIQEDQNDKLWIATENFGLSRIDLKTFRIRNFPIPINGQLEDRYINTFFIDEKGIIWIGAETGISFFDPANERYTKVSIEAPDDEREIIAFSKDENDVLWAFGYTGHVYFKKHDQKKFSVLKQQMDVDYVSNVKKDGPGALLISTSNGIFNLLLNRDPARSQLKKFTSVNTSDPIADLEIDRNGTMWIANKNKGIQLYYNGIAKLQNLNISWLSPIEPGIADWNDIMVDKEGGVWLGGNFGLYHYNSNYNQFNVYKAISKFVDQFSFGRYVGVANFKNDIITVSSRGVSIYSKELNDFISLKYENGLEKKLFLYNSIVQIAVKTWWIATSEGILELQHRDNDYLLRRPEILKKHPVLGKKSVYVISVGRDEKIWFATPEDGLLLFDKISGVTRTYLQFGTGIHKSTISHLDFVTISPEGDIAVGHHRGFAVKFHDQNEFQHVEQLVENRYDFSKLSVYDMEFSGGYLWVGSESNGLLRFDFKQKSIKVYTMEDGMVSNSITSIHGIGDYKIAIGTNRGMSIMDIPSGTFTTFLKKDGLPSEEFENAVDHDIEGKEFFMATTQGVISFFKDNLRQSIIKPKLLLFSIIRNGKHLDDSTVDVLRKNLQFKLKYNESLNLQFSTLNFSNDNDFNLRFKMNDNEEWNTSPTSDNLLLFNLDAGIYDMTVQLIGRRSGIMSKQLKVKLEVLPPFYNTRLFRFILLFLILGLLYFPVKWTFRNRFIKQQKELEKKQLLEQERVRIAMDLHDDIGGNLTALSLMTSLLKDKEFDASARLLIDKIGEASDKMVQDMNEIVWALNSTYDSLASLMAYIRQQISQKLSEADILFEIKEPITYPEMYVSGRVRRNVHLIIKEIINNAVKYSGSRNIEMRVVLDTKLKITIVDNGRGMPNEMTHETIKGGGNGLNNIRKRAGMLNASVIFLNERGVTTIFEMPLDQFDK